MNIGIDIHGCIDKYSGLFKSLSERWAAQNHVIHIVTGQEWEIAAPSVRACGIVYHEFFSIVDYHKNIGTEVWKRSDKNGYWMDEAVWNASKGEYAKRSALDIHFDDSVKYAQYFPSHCAFIHVPAINFEEIYKNCLTLSV